MEFSINQCDVDRVNKNLNGLKERVESIQNEHQQSVDIVVLPEYAVTGYTFHSRESISPLLEEIPDFPVQPCGNYNYNNCPIFQRLSCIARDNKIVLVANMGEKEICAGDEKCSSDGQYQFNTNVVFEKDGTFITKYRKQHLFGPEKDFLDPGTQKACVTFTTTFGVKFGTFTCYDILYPDPGSCLLKDDVENFVYTTAWGNSFPFYMSIAVQQGWSLKHQVNFLAANQHDPTIRASGTGSGLYTAGAAVEYLLNSSAWQMSTGRYLVATLPKKPALDTETQHGGIVSQNLTASSSKYAQFEMLEGTSSVVTVNYKNQLTCILKYSRETTAKEYYALGAYYGQHPRDETFGYAFCSVVKCGGDSPKTCGSIVDGFKASTEFTEFELSGDFPNKSDVYATALGNGLILLNPSFIKLQGNTVHIETKVPLLAASLWTRVPIQEDSAYCNRDGCS